MKYPNQPLWEKMRKQQEKGEVSTLTLLEMRAYLKTLPDEVQDHYKEHPGPLYFRGKPIYCASDFFAVKGTKTNLKRWFDDWGLETKWKGKYRILLLRLPYSKTRQKTFYFYEEDMKGKFEDIEGILACCFHQIQSDNGGYKNDD